MDETSFDPNKQYYSLYLEVLKENNTLRKKLSEQLRYPLISCTKEYNFPMVQIKYRLFAGNTAPGLPIECTMSAIDSILAKDPKIEDELERAALQKLGYKYLKSSLDYWAQKEKEESFGVLKWLEGDKRWN